MTMRMESDKPEDRTVVQPNAGNNPGLDTRHDWTTMVIMDPQSLINELEQLLGPDIDGISSLVNNHVRRVGYSQVVSAEMEAHMSPEGLRQELMFMSVRGISDEIAKHLKLVHTTSFVHYMGYEGYERL